MISVFLDYWTENTILTVEFIWKEKVEKSEHNIFLYKMNNKNWQKVLLKTLNMVFDEYPNIRGIVNKV